jgi:hypothetical protein
LALRIAGSVIVLQPSTGGMQPGSFNTYDDFQAYIVYPLKMRTPARWELIRSAFVGRQTAHWAAAPFSKPLC